MIHFSYKKQSFYDVELNYTDLPDDLIEVSSEQHYILLEKINNGCHIFSDLSVSAPRPSSFHLWQNGKWMDSRTPDQIQENELKALTPLTRRQFRMVLVLNGYDLDEIKAQILAIEDTQTRQLTLVEWEDATTFERDNASLVMMAGLLGLNDDQVNAMWKQALTL